jgi:hypothetical protein
MHWRVIGTGAWRSMQRETENIAPVGGGRPSGLKFLLVKNQDYSEFNLLQFFLV